jgi:uncharacterized membrane protein
MPNFARTHVIDLFVLTWFIACWAGYAHFAKRKARRPASLVVAMRLYRREWCRRVLQHENRIADIAAFDAMTKVASHAAEDFNQGLRAFYFALAAIAWFFHPWLSVASSLLVVCILRQREFRSRTLLALTVPAVINRSPDLPAKRPPPR